MSGHISLVTQQHSPKLANPVNAVAATALVTRYSSATPTVTASTSYTRPTTITATSATAANAGGVLVVPGGMNYLKIMPLWLTGAGAVSPTIRVVGWSYSKDANVWVSSLIANIACTLNTVGGVVNAGATLLPCISITNSIGDAKIFNATSLACNAFFVVDTLGFEQIELCFQVASGGPFTCNAFVSEI